MDASPMANGKMELDESSNGLYMGVGTSPSVDSGFSGSSGPGGSVDDLGNAVPAPTAEERLAWESELAKVEEEIRTLRQVLQAKLRRQQDLKRKLGITQLDELKTDINVTLKTISESDAFIKTSSTLKTAGQKTGVALSAAGQKTGEVLGSAGTSLKGKLGEMRNSPSFQSFGSSVGSTWGSLKRQVSTSMRTSQSAHDVNVAPGPAAEAASVVENGREPEELIKGD